jgi:hypothetical protein
MNNTLLFILKFWQKPGLSPLSPTAEQSASFSVFLKGKSVGLLRFADDKWTFEYDKGLEEPLIVDFPSLTRTYESQALWPFFASRIPGLKHPYVIEALKAKGLENKPPTEVDMLRWFGSRTLTNQYELVAQPGG